MYKYLFSILLIILLTSCSTAQNETSISLTASTKSNPVIKTQPTKETTQSQYPQILTSMSAKTIDFALQSEGIFCICTNQKYGFMTESGQDITSFDYNLAFPFSEGLACVCRNGKYGFINTKGEQVIPLFYDKASSFSEGLAYFEIGNRYGFINQYGEKAFLLNCDSVSSFKEGLAYFSSDGKYGYIDKSGNEVIKPLYDDAGYFQNGIAKVRQGCKIGAIDKSGKEIVQPIYDDVSINKNLIITELNHKYGCINSSGVDVLMPKYDSISVEENNMVIFTTKEKWGLADANGNVILNPLYDYMELIPEKDFAIIEQNSKRGIIDYNGMIRVPLKYDSVSYDSQNNGKLISVTLKDKMGFLSLSDYTEKIPLIYDYASNFCNGLASVELGKKYGVIDENGSIVVPFEYDSTKIYDNGIISLKRNNQYDLADTNGKVITKNQYDSIELKGSCFIVETNDIYGVLDLNGNIVIPPTYNYISENYNNVYNSPNCYITTKYGDQSVNNSILITNDDQDIDLSSVILTNEITPKIKLFSDYTKTGHIGVSFSEVSTPANLDGLNNCSKTFKLFDVDGSGKPILYIYAEPFISYNFQESYSGFFAINNNKVNELLTGYECGGSAGGNYVCFYKDNKTSKIVIGTFNHAGGFGGHAAGEDYYNYKNGKAYKIASRMWVSQTAGNYEITDLIKYACLFYNEQGIPFTKDTIKQADAVTEYLINDKRVTVDEYENITKRFKSIPQEL